MTRHISKDFTAAQNATVWLGVPGNGSLYVRRFGGFPGKRTEMPLRAVVIFLALSLGAHAGWLKPDVDFSNYDVPLYEQIINRIKAKISSRL